MATLNTNKHMASLTANWLILAFTTSRLTLILKNSILRQTLWTADNTSPLFTPTTNLNLNPSNQYQYPNDLSSKYRLAISPTINNKSSQSSNNNLSNNYSNGQIDWTSSPNLKYLHPITTHLVVYPISNNPPKEKD